MNNIKMFSVFKNNLFKDKVAIVTGGGTGIGKAIAKELLYLGCRVVIASRNKDGRITAAVKELEHIFQADTSPKIMGVTCNIRKEEQVQSLIQETLKVYGKLDYVVNNGGGQFLSSAADITVNGWNAVVETNLKGSFLMCREAFNQYMKDNGGAIVNILMDFYRGTPMMAHSGAARSGLDNLTKTLAIEWAQNGIRVNAVAPGHSIYSETAKKNYPIDVFQVVTPNLPTKRLGTPEEISSAVCFLLSPGASFISGETLYVDGAERLYSPLYWVISDHNKLPPPSASDSDDPDVQSKL